MVNEISEFSKSSENFYSSLSIIPEGCKNKFYNGVSPRHLEAASLKTLQILVRGNYGDILKEYRDFVPLEEDCSNIKEVLEIFSNSEKCLEIVDNCLKTVETDKRLDGIKLIDFILAFIKTDATGIKKQDNSRIITLRKQIRYEYPFIFSSDYIKKGINKIGGKFSKKKI